MENTHPIVRSILATARLNLENQIEMIECPEDVIALAKDYAEQKATSISKDINDIDLPDREAAILSVEFLHIQ